MLLSLNFKKISKAKIYIEYRIIEHSDKIKLDLCNLFWENLKMEKKPHQ